MDDNPKVPLVASWSGSAFLDFAADSKNVRIIRHRLLRPLETPNVSTEVLCRCLTRVLAASALLHMQRERALRLLEQDGTTAAALLSRLTEGAPRRVCQYAFKLYDIVWICKSCQADETCVLCNECFRGSSHEGHEVYFYHAQAGGCCDCGDPDAWDSSGFCSKHGLDGRDPLQDLPEGLRESGAETIAEIVEFLLALAADIVASFDLGDEQPAAAPLAIRSSGDTSGSGTGTGGASSSGGGGSSSGGGSGVGGGSSNGGGGGGMGGGSHWGSVAAAASSSPAPRDRPEALALFQDAESATAATAAGPRVAAIVHFDDVHPPELMTQWLQEAANMDARHAAEAVSLIQLHGEVPVAAAATRAQLLPLARALQQVGALVSLRPATLDARAARATTLVGWLNDVAQVSDGTCRLVCEQLSVPVLTSLMEADARLPRDLSKALHVLYLTLMADQPFKTRVATAYVRTLLPVTRDSARGIGAADHSLYTLSVQFLNRSAFVKELVESHSLLQILSQCLLATLTPACREEETYADEGEYRRHTVLDTSHMVLQYRRYLPIIADLKCVLNIEGIPRCFLGACFNDWMRVLSLVQGMNGQTRKMRAHVEYEPREWMYAFNVNISLTSVFDHMLGWLRHPISATGHDAGGGGGGGGNGARGSINAAALGVLWSGPQQPLPKDLFRSVFRSLRTELARGAHGAYRTAQEGMHPSAAMAAAGGMPRPRTLGGRSLSQGGGGGDGGGSSSSGGGAQSSKRALPRYPTGVLELPPPPAQRSFHVAMYRFLGAMVKEACCCQERMGDLWELSNYVGSYPEVGTAFVDTPLLVLELASEVKVGMWCRNGQCMNDQVLNYSEPPFCKSFRDLDLLVVQFAALSYGPNKLINHVLHRYQCFHWLFGDVLHPDNGGSGGAGNSDSGAASSASTSTSADFPGSVGSETPPHLNAPLTLLRHMVPGAGALLQRMGRREPLEAAHQMGLAEECLLLLIQLLTEMPLPPDETPSAATYASGGSGPQRTGGPARPPPQPPSQQALRQLRRELIHRLAAGPCTHSELQDSWHQYHAAHNDIVPLEAMEAVLADIAVRREAAGALEPGKFVLKEEAYAEYDPTFPRITLQTHQQVGERRPRPKGPAPVAPPPPEAHPIFQLFRVSMLREDALIHAAGAILAQCAARAAGRFSETLLMRALHLLTLAVHVYGSEAAAPGRSGGGGGATAAVSAEAAAAADGGRGGGGDSSSGALGDVADASNGGVYGGGDGGGHGGGNGGEAAGPEAGTTRGRASVAEGSGGGGGGGGSGGGNRHGESRSPTPAAIEAAMEVVPGGGGSATAAGNWGPPLPRQAAEPEHRQGMPISPRRAFCQALLRPLQGLVVTPPTSASAAAAAAGAGAAAGAAAAPPPSVVSLLLLLKSCTWLQEDHTIAAGLEWLLLRLRLMDEGCRAALPLPEDGADADSGRRDMEARKQAARQRALLSMQEKAKKFAEEMELLESSDEESGESGAGAGNVPETVPGTGVASSADNESSGAAGSGADASGASPSSGVLSVVAGSSGVTAAAAASEPQCIVCREFTGAPLGYVGFGQRSRVLDAAPRGGRPTWALPGVHLQFCGHALHYGCFDRYFQTVLHFHESQRDVAIDTRRGEFQCPLCKSIANLLAPHTPPPPLLPPHAAGGATSAATPGNGTPMVLSPLSSPRHLSDGELPPGGAAAVAAGASGKGGPESIRPGGSSLAAWLRDPSGLGAAMAEAPAAAMAAAASDAGDDAATLRFLQSTVEISEGGGASSAAAASAALSQACAALAYTVASMAVVGSPSDLIRGVADAPEVQKLEHLRCVVGAMRRTMQGSGVGAAARPALAQMLAEGLPAGADIAAAATMAGAKRPGTREARDEERDSLRRPLLRNNIFEVLTMVLLSLPAGDRVSARRTVAALAVARLVQVLAGYRAKAGESLFPSAAAHGSGAGSEGPGPEAVADLLRAGARQLEEADRHRLRSHCYSGTGYYSATGEAQEDEDGAAAAAGGGDGGGSSGGAAAVADMSGIVASGARAGGGSSTAEPFAFEAAEYLGAFLRCALLLVHLCADDEALVSETATGITAETAVTAQRQRQHEELPATDDFRSLAAFFGVFLSPAELLADGETVYLVRRWLACAVDPASAAAGAVAAATGGSLVDTRRGCGGGSSGGGSSGVGGGSSSGGGGGGGGFGGSRRGATGAPDDADAAAWVEGQVARRLGDYPMPVRVELVRLPHAYTELHADLARRSSSEHPAICMICGVVLNAHGTGECTTHAQTCGCGVGVIFLLQECSVLLIAGQRAAYFPSPYVDAYGEHHRHFRGRPLFLDERRNNVVRNLWARHGIVHEVVQSRSTARQVIIEEYY